MKFLVQILTYDRDKHFCLQTFFVSKYFRFYLIFNVKIATPLLTPSFPPSPLKLEVVSGLPFWKFGRWFNPPAERVGGAHYGTVGSAMLFCHCLRVSYIWFYQMINFYWRYCHPATLAKLRPQPPILSMTGIIFYFSFSFIFFRFLYSLSLQ